MFQKIMSFMKTKNLWIQVFLIVWIFMSTCLFFLNSGSLLFIGILLAGIFLFAFFQIISYYHFKNIYSLTEIKSIAFFQGIILALLLTALFLLKYPVRFDMTKNQSFSLSTKTQEILKTLPFKVKIIVLQDDFTPDLTLGTFGKEIYMNLKNLLVEYKKTSPMIEVEYLDPNSDKAKSRHDKINNVGDLVFETDQDKKYQKKEYLVEWGSRRNPRTGDFERLITAYKIEEKITSNILSLMQVNKPSIIWLEGDGEIGLEGNTSASILQEEILNNQYLIRKSFLSASDEKLIDSAVAMIIAGPVKTLPEFKVKTIETFLKKGKALILLFDPSLDEIPTGLEKLIESKFKIKPENSIVVDDYHSYQTISNIAAFYAEHPVNLELHKQNMQTILSLAAPVELLELNPQKSNVNIEVLLGASENAWEERNIKAVKRTGRLDLSKKYEVDLSSLKIGQPNKQDEHKHDHNHDHSNHKNITLAAIATHNLDRSKLLIIGDSDFIRNTNISISGNKDFMINAINYLLERKTPLSISKPINPDKVILIDEGNKKYFFMLYVVAMPLITAFIGGWIALKRRKMRISKKNNSPS